MPLTLPNVVADCSSLGHHLPVSSRDEIREALRDLVRTVRGGNGRARQNAPAWLVARSGGEWLSLDDNARDSGWEGAIVAGDWATSKTVDESGLTDLVASWHADGRLRQHATQRLAARSGRLVAAALAVRCLDHVQQVREDALLGVLLQTGDDAVDAVVGVFTAGLARDAAPAALQAYTNQLLATPGGADKLSRHRGHPDRRVRRWAVTTALDRRLLSPAQAFDLTRTDADQLIRARCASWLATGPPDIAARLLTVRFVEARLAALQQLPDHDLAEDALRAALLDRSPRVRALAQWRSRRRGIDAAEIYRARLLNRQPREVAAALAGLASVGTAQDAPRIASLLHGDRPVVRASAVSALAALASPEDVIPLLAPLLMDPSPRVTAAAARALVRVGAGADVTAVARASDQVASRKAAWRVHRAAGGWDRVEADLRAAGDRDLALAENGRAGVKNWLQVSAATTWRQPTPAQHATMTRLLTQCGASEEVGRHVAFHAGLPWSAPTPPAPPTDELDPPPPARWWQRLARRRVARGQQPSKGAP